MPYFNLDVDIILVDTTSTYWEMEAAAELAEVAGDDEDGSLPSRRARGCSGTPRTTGTTCPRW